MLISERGDTGAHKSTHSLIMYRESSWFEGAAAPALSFLISFHLLRDLGKGQAVAVVTVIQTDCRSPPLFTGTIHAFLMVVDGIDGEREW